MHSTRNYQNFLDAFLTGVVKERTVNSRPRCLSILAIRDGIGQEGAMLWSVRCRVSITSELFHGVFGMERSTYPLS